MSDIDDAWWEFDDAWSRVCGRPVDPPPEPRTRERHDLIEPSEEEKRNGWDSEKLTDYIRERERAGNERIDLLATRQKRPTRQNGRRFSFGPAARGKSWGVRTRNFGPWAGKRR